MDRYITHEHNLKMLKEFYHHNKYIVTEQMKDALLDAIDCIEKLIEVQNEQQIHEPREIY